MSKGWRNESQRHSLSAKGIRTSRRVIPFREYKAKYSYSNPTEMFKAFWKASIEGDWGAFDFGEAFRVGAEVTKLWVEQSDCSPEDVVLFFKESGLDDESTESILDLDCDLMWRDYTISKLHLELKNPPERLDKKIRLMDELIHFEHATGSIWEDESGEEFDVDEMREEFDEEYGGVKR